MVDTVRTSSDLLTNLFQDGQAAGSITANDVRDLIVSARPSFGECSVQNNATATTISVTGTYVKMACTTALSGNERLFDDDGGTSNRLRYTGAPQRLVTFQASMCFTAASNNQEIGFEAWLYDDSAGSGALITETLITQFIANTGQVESINIHGHALMDTNDYLEIHVANETSTANMTLVDLNFQVIGYLQ